MSMSIRIRIWRWRQTGRLVEREVELFEREVDAAHEREAEQSLFRHETSHFFETDPKPFTSKSNA